jgi:hypothetical protein
MIEKIKPSINNLIDKIWLYVRTLFFNSRTYLNTELAARERVKRLLDYYQGNQLAYVKQLLTAQFQPEEAAALKLQPAIVNVVRQITNKLCLTFKDGVIVNPSNDKDEPIIEKIIDDINLDNLLRTVEIATFLCKTCFVKVGWRNNKIACDIVTPELVEVVQNLDDPYQIDEIIYPQIIYNNQDLQGIFNWWTYTDFKVIDEKKNVQRNDNNPDNVNPYGLIPIAIFREKMPTNSQFWAFPSEDLICAQDNINVLLTESNELIKMQSFATPVVKNPSVDDKGKVNIKMGLSKPIVFTDSDKERPGDFKYESPNAQIESVEASIDKEITRLLGTYGIDASSAVASGDAKSASSMREGNAAVDEYRSNTRQVFIPAIKNLFEIITQVYNTHAEELGLPKLSGDGIKVTIQKSTVNYNTADERIKDWGFLFNNRLGTPIDYILQQHDDLTYNEALQKYKDNIQFFKDFQVETTNTGNNSEDISTQNDGNQKNNIPINNEQNPTATS